MICPNCGSENLDSNVNCANCGRQLQPLNGGNQVYNTNQNSLTPPGDGKATLSLVFGIIGIFTCTGLIFPILAIVFGNMAKKEGYVGGKASAGTIMGIITLILGIIVLALLIVLTILGAGLAEYLS